MEKQNKLEFTSLVVSTFSLLVSCVALIFVAIEIKENNILTHKIQQINNLNFYVGYEYKIAEKYTFKIARPDIHQDAYETHYMFVLRNEDKELVYIEVSEETYNKNNVGDYYTYLIKEGK